MALDRERRWASAEDFKQAITTKPVSARGIGETALPSTQVVTPPAPSQATPVLAAMQIPGSKIPYGWLTASGLALLIVILVGWLIGSILTRNGKETPFVVSTTESATVLPIDTELPVIGTVLPASSTEPVLPPSALTGDFTDEHGVPMKLIPAGEFQMGGDADVAVQECEKLCPSCSCDRSNYEYEEPAHTVYLVRSIWI